MTPDGRAAGEKGGKGANGKERGWLERNVHGLWPEAERHAAFGRWHGWRKVRGGAATKVAEGEFKFHYYLTSTKDTSRTFATRFGWGSRVPLATRVLPPVKTGAVREPQKLSALAVTPSNLLIVETRPTRNGDGIFLHLRELEGKPVTITEEEVRTATGMQSADEVNVLEEAVHPGIESPTFKPYEVKFLKLMFR